MASTAPIKVPILGIDKFSKVFKKAGRDATLLGKKISGVGRKLTMGVSMPLLGAGVASLKFGNDFNAAMARVATMIPGQRKKLQEYKKDIMDLAVTSGTSSTILADGMYSVISALGDTSNSMSALKIATSAAKAGVSDVQTAVELLAGTANAYGDTSDKMLSKISDMAFMAVKLGVTTFPELAAAMGKTLATAKDAGVGMRELYAHTATLTKVIHGADQASTALDSVMGELLKGGSKLSDAFKGLGVRSGVELIKKFGGLQNALIALKKYVGDDATAFRQLFGRKEAMKGASLLTGALKDLAKQNLSIIDTAGATQEALEEQTEGINKAGFMAEQAKERFKNLGIKISDKLTPILIKFGERLLPVLDRISALSDSALSLGVKIAGIAILVGPALSILGSVITSLGSLSALVGAGGLTGALAALAGPVGLAIAGFAALTAGVIYFRDELQPVFEVLKNIGLEIFKNIKDAVLSATGAITALASAFRGWMSIGGPVIAIAVKIAAGLAMMPFKWLIASVKISSKVLSGLAKVFKIVSSAFRIVVFWIGNLIKKFTTTTTIGKNVAKAFAKISDALSVVGGWFKTVWKTASDFFSGVGGWLDKLGIELDSAAEKQKNVFEGKAQTTEFRAQQDIVQNIKQSSESNITVTFDNMPDWAKPQVTKAQGASVKAQTGRGAIMQGAY
jgi:TP901 family phage tail tape measure protein